MKRILFLLLMSALGFSVQAQTGLYEKVRQAIETRYPEVQTQNRLIAVNFWSAGDQASRDLNKAFNKTHNTYTFARLKGGLHGLIGVAVCIDPSGEGSAVLLDRDGTGELLPLVLSDLDLSEKPCVNIVFDSSGNKVYSDLPAQEVFTKINQLLTR